MMVGAHSDQTEKPFEAALELVKTPRPAAATFASASLREFAYVMAPTSNAPFMAVAKLQAANVPVYRTAGAGTFGPGTWVVPATAESGQILSQVSRATGIEVRAPDRPLE